MSEPGSADGPSQHDFIFWSQLGKGAFGVVWLAQEKKALKRYLAIKTINKKAIVQAEGDDRQRKVQRLLNERQILQHLDHPFIVTLEYFFQDETRLYFGMSLAGCGDFFTILEETNGGAGLGMVACRYYAAELCLALEYIHSLGIIYRDLKLENFLLARDGHLVLTDFGMASYHNPRERTASTAGTPEYFAPEMVKEEAYGQEVDWWAFGVSLYEMLCGKSPFTGNSIAATMKNVIMKDAKLPGRALYATSKLEMKHTQGIINGLLSKEANTRLGAEGVKEHPWFKGYKIQENVNAANATWSWEDVLAKKVPPPLKRQHVLESPALVALMKARDAKEKKDQDVFYQLETFKRDEGRAGGGADAGAGAGGELKLPNLGNMNVNNSQIGTADHSVEQTETATVTTPRIPSAAPAAAPAPAPAAPVPDRILPLSDPLPPSWGDYDEDLVSMGLEDADEPVLRTVSYKIRSDIFVDDPRGRDVAIQELLDDLSNFWTSTVKGFNFFGVQYKKENDHVTLSMVFKNKFYLNEYKKGSLLQILAKYKDTLASSNLKDWHDAGNRFGILARDETIVPLSTSTTSSPNLAADPRALPSSLNNMDKFAAAIVKPDDEGGERGEEGLLHTISGSVSGNSRSNSRSNSTVGSPNLAVEPRTLPATLS